MGCDCTLHVVDEALIRNEFVPRILCKINCTSPFDHRPDSIKICERVRSASNKQPIDDEIYSPKKLQRWYPNSLSFIVHLCCLIIMSVGTVYLYWITIRNTSEKYRGNPEEIFYELLAVYPELRGQFPK